MMPPPRRSAYPIPYEDSADFNFFDRADIESSMLEIDNYDAESMAQEMMSYHEMSFSSNSIAGVRKSKR